MLDFGSSKADPLDAVTIIKRYDAAERVSSTIHPFRRTNIR